MYSVIQNIISKFNEETFFSYVPGEDFDEHHFAGIFWTNILANIVAIFIIISTSITVSYLILNTFLKFKINVEIKKLLNRKFLIPNLESMSFFALIDYINIIKEEELTKRLKKKFTSETFGKVNSIENQMSLYKNVFTNFRTYRNLVKWNKSVDILKRFDKTIFKNITNLSIASSGKELIFVYKIMDNESSIRINKNIFNRNNK